MQVTRDFAPADRYVYDTDLCSIKNGFAQVDTRSDAWYFGTWANPFKLAILTYAEGDVTLQVADSPDEFVHLLRRIQHGHKDWGSDFIGIDPGFDVRLANRFRNLGLGDLLH